jgi:hypothetical protein
MLNYAVEDDKRELLDVSMYQQLPGNDVEAGTVTTEGAISAHPKKAGWYVTSVDDIAKTPFATSLL